MASNFSEELVVNEPKLNKNKRGTYLRWVSDINSAYIQEHSVALLTFRPWGHQNHPQNTLIAVVRVVAPNYSLHSPAHAKFHLLYL